MSGQNTYSSGTLAGGEAVSIPYMSGQNEFQKGMSDSQITFQSPICRVKIST